MRKLKVQMQMSLDGFVSTPDSKPIMPQSTDAVLQKVMFQDIVETCDTILLGRKIAMEGFVGFWAQQAVSGTGWLKEYGSRTLNMRKIMFSSSVQHAKDENVEVENGPLVTAVRALKAKPGKDMITYGGYTFVASLLEQGLVDELYLFINPVALSGGGRIFKGRTEFQLLNSTRCSSGVVINAYATNPVK